MSRRTWGRQVRSSSVSDVRQHERSYRLVLEALEDRVMLDSGVGSASPLPIVVGRILSAYTVGAVQNHQETLTYTVYNEQADPETGVLLTTTLEPGVTVTSASLQPDQSGQNLAWSLGTIGGYGRLSVALTVSLTSPIPLQLDSGAHAYAMLDGVAVSNSTPAAALRPGNVAPSLLASTPDANTTDPFVQEEAARLHYNPTQIFDFLHTQIGYNAYLGSVRGARGTLWSSAGNALDVASLGVALMRASGIPAQYAQGTLPQTFAQQLILSMFPAGDQTVGSIPAGTQTSDPANDQQLLSETESHHWFQFDSGSGMQNADPLMAGAAIGQTFTTATGTFAEVPDNLREKTEIKLSAEIYSQVSAAFGGSPLTTSTVLDQTYNDVDLVGRPLSVGNFVSTTINPGRITSFTTNTYTPYVDMGDEADPARDTILQGTPYQEVLTSFPLASQILTGLFLDVNLTGPEGPPASYERTLVDRIGYATRQGGSAVSVAVDSSGAPTISDTDIQTLNILPGLQSPAAAQLLQDRLAQEQPLVAAGAAQAQPSSGSVAAVRTSIITSEQSELVQFALRSQNEATNLAVGSSVAAYFDRPGITIAGTQFDAAAGSVNLSFDLRRETMRVVPSPGQNSSAVKVFNFTKGLLDNVYEQDVVPTAPGAASLGTFSVFQQAVAQGVPFARIRGDNISTLSPLDLSADAKARITTAVSLGEVVMVPIHDVTIGTKQAISWLEINPSTGEVSGVLEDGTRSVIAEEGATEGGQGAITTQLIRIAENSWAARANSVLAQLRNLPRNQAGKQALANEIDSLLRSPFVPYDVSDLKPILAICSGFLHGMIAAGDPPLPNFRVGLDIPYPDVLSNPASGSIQIAANTRAGVVVGSDKASNLALSGQLSATWATTSTSTLQAASITTSTATVVDASGKAIGTGAVALATDSSAMVEVSGNARYIIGGQGSLSFYGPAESSLGVSGNWNSYSAAATGSVTLTLTTAGLSLNGQALPAGTYTVTTSSATLTGSGPSVSPNFSGSAAISAANSAVNLGPATGTVTIGGSQLGSGQGVAMSGYTGTIGVSANGDGTDTVEYSGTTVSVLSVSESPGVVTTDQNTPATFAVKVDTSLTDAYTLTAQAPQGWTVTIDSSGNVKATPAPGTQGGTYPVAVVARSTTNPDLVAQGVVDVTVTRAQPGLSLSVEHDTVYSVPSNGVQVPTAFRASVQNLGPAAGTFTLSFSNVPAGFTIFDTASALTVPAGRTGITGVYLQPTGQIPAAGTQLTFTVTATSTTNPAITQTQNVVFAVPAIDAVTVSANPSSFGATPGSPVTTTVSLSNMGNTPESVTLAAAPATGLTVFGFSPVTLQPGQTTTESISLTPAGSSALNSLLSATITATYGPASAPSSSIAQLFLTVRSPQVVAVQQSSAAAGSAQNTELSSNLSDLADALASLQVNQTDAASLTRVNLLLGDLNSLLVADPALAASSAGLQPLLSAAGSGDVSGLVAQAPAFFASLSSLLAREAAQQFTMTVSPSEIDLQPGQGATLSLELTSQGTAPTSLALSTTALPAGVSATFGQPMVTLNPGQSVTVPITLSQSLQTTKVFTLGVAAKASLVRHTASAVVAVRPAAADVLSVTASPAGVAAGGTVSVSAQVFDTANAARTLMAQVHLLDVKGAVVLTLPTVLVQLVPGGQPVTVPFGPLSTTGLAPGIYTVQASLLTADGAPLPGKSARAPLLVGQSVTASISSSPTAVAPGTATVTATISVANTSSATGGGGTSNAVDLYFTEYAGSNSVNSVPITYNGTSLAVGTVVSVAQNVPADGLTFLPNGNLLVAYDTVSQVNPVTGQVKSVSANGGAFHVALDPNGQKIWTSDQPGPYLIEVPLNPFSAGIPHRISGDDTVITALAFDKAGTAYYTNGGPSGYGNFGIVDLSTFTTKRYFTNLPAAHGIIYDPLTGDLIIVGSSHVTQIDPTTMKVVSDRNFSSMGISSLDQGAVDSKGHLYVADNGGKLLFIDYSKTGLIGDPSNFVATPFVANYFDDVAPLAGLGSLGTFVQIQHLLPPSGFSVDPSTLNPTPASTSVTEIDWQTSLPTGTSTPQTFTARGKAANMAPGETRTISLGTNVNAYTLAADGTRVKTTIPLPSLTVAAEHFISITPPAQTVEQGAEATYTIQLTNPYPRAETFTLTTEGLDGFTTALAPTVTVQPGQTTSTTLRVNVSVGSAADTTGFRVLAATSDGAQDSVEGQLTVSSEVLLPAQAVNLQLAPTQALAGQGAPATYQLTLTNVGDATDTYQLTGIFPAGFTARFTSGSPDFTLASGSSGPTVTVAPGSSNAVHVVLTLTARRGSATGNQPFTVSATSTTNAAVTASARGVADVSSSGVGVALNPQAGGPGTGFEMTVTNTGTVSDTFDLALGGPGGLVASLAANQVTLAPGASQEVPIATGAVNFASSGPLNLTAIAVSHGNPAVKGDATANLAIPSTQSLTAQFNPASQTLDAPGTASFTLFVDNTGNTEDSYRISIIGASGPITASLVGLDGSPTQTIPVFRLPGLSSGAIIVETNLASLEQGTVTVQVTSLDHAGITSTAVATLIVPALGPPLPADGPTVVSLQRFGIHRMPTTLVLHFSEALNAALAQNVKEYHLVGPLGQTVPITQAVYDAMSDTVTLHLGRRINFHRRFELTVYGATPSGLANAQGLLLNSKAGSNPGSNYVTTVDRRNLVWPAWYKKQIRKERSVKEPRSTKTAAGRKVDTSPLFKRSWSFPANRASSRSVTHAGKDHQQLQHVIKNHDSSPAEG